MVELIEAEEEFNGEQETTDQYDDIAAEFEVHMYDHHRWCSKCQRPHHTLLHVETPNSQSAPDMNTVTSHAATGLKANTLMMTCHAQITGPDGSAAKAHGLLDCASSTLSI